MHPLHSERIERVLFDETAIRDRVVELGREIEANYVGRPLTIVMIMQGGVIFAADLIRAINLPMKVESLAVASYHGATESCGEVTFLQNCLPNLEGRDVLIVDDILDSGRTLSAICECLMNKQKPLSLKTCVLLSKKIERAVNLEADYVGFSIGDEFVVGYGLDFDGEFRNLPEIAVLKPA